MRGLRALCPRTATVALAIVVAGSGWLGWDSWHRQAVFEQAYATGRGQRLTAMLPDTDGAAGARGSTMQLDTLTRAHVQLS